MTRKGKSEKGAEKLNLVWAIVEGYYGGAFHGSKMAPPLHEVSFPAVRFTDMIAASPTTSMAVMGMFTGINPYALRFTHLKKGMTDDVDWQKKCPHALPFLLERKGYRNHFISWVKGIGKTVSLFADSEAGLTRELKEHNETLDTHRGGFDEPLNPLFWLPEIVEARIRNTLGKLKKSPKPGAYFLHCLTVGEYELFMNELEKIGVTPENSLMVVSGDHGWPKRLEKLQEIRPELNKGVLTHDTDLDDTCVKIVCHLGYPGVKPRDIPDLTSALDLMPTVAKLLGLGLNTQKARLDGRDLTGLIKAGRSIPHRVVRIDNRYIGQGNNQITALFTPEYRYILRVRTEWIRQKYYRYATEPHPHHEELYVREDIDGVRDLSFHPNYLEVLKGFRRQFMRSEGIALVRLYGTPAGMHAVLASRLPWINERLKKKALRNAKKLIIPNHLMVAAATNYVETMAGGGARHILLAGPPNLTSFILANMKTPGGVAVTPHNPFTAADPPPFDAAIICDPLTDHTGLKKLRPHGTGKIPVRSLFTPFAAEMGDLRQYWPFTTRKDLVEFVSSSTLLYGIGGVAMKFLETPIGKAIRPRVLAATRSFPMTKGERFLEWDIIDPYRIPDFAPEKILVASAAYAEIVPFIRRIAGQIPIYRIDDDGEPVAARL